MLTADRKPPQAVVGGEHGADPVGRQRHDHVDGRSASSRTRTTGRARRPSCAGAADASSRSRSSPRQPAVQRRYRPLRKPVALSRAAPAWGAPTCTGRSQDIERSSRRARSEVAREREALAGTTTPCRDTSGGVHSNSSWRPGQYTTRNSTSDSGTKAPERHRPVGGSDPASAPFVRRMAERQHQRALREPAHSSQLCRNTR